MSRATKMNSITSPELLAQVNPKNTSLLNDFVDYMRSVQRSEKTISGYVGDIQIFFVWNLQFNDNKFYVDVTKRNIVSYQNWLLNTNKNSPARVRRLKASLSSMGNFIEGVLDDEFPDFRNIINKVESPTNQPVREKTIWEPEELETLLEKLLAAGEYQKACALALGIYSGRRKAELGRFKVSDFAEENLVCNGALYKSAPLQTKGRGGGKYLNCYTLAKGFTPYLTRWLEYREQNGIESEWLFPTPGKMDSHIEESMLNSWAKTFTRMTGKDFYWHSLRHYFTTLLSKQGLPDNIIQEIVGWESADMVRVYKDISAEEQMAQFFDEDGNIKAGTSKSLADL